MAATGFVGQPVSSFAPANALFNPMMALNQTKAEQEIGANEAEMIARVSQGLLDPKLYPDEASRAAAWGPAVRQLQGIGFAQKADPDLYPGEATLRRASLLGTPSSTQAEWQSNIAANQAIASAGRTGTGTGTTPGTTVATQPPAQSGAGYAPSGTGTPYVAPNLPQGVTAEEDQAVRTVIGEAGAEPVIGQAAVAHVIKNRATQSGKSATDVIFAPNQFEPWNNPTTRARLEAIDPNSAQYQQILNNVVRPTFAGQSQDPTGGATHFFSPTAQAQLGREPPSWAANQTPAVIGRHNFYNIGYRAPGGGTAQTQTAAAGDTGPVILGDSLAVGLGGSDVGGAKPVVGAKPGQVLEQIQTAAKNGSLKGRDVVISSGASNAPSEVARVEEQIREAKKGGARSVTVTGVGTRPDIVGSNAVIQQIAERNGARFVPVDPATLSGDQVHPENYGPLKQAVGAVTAAPGGVAARTGGVDVAGPGGAPPSIPQPPPNTLAPANLPRRADGTIDTTKVPPGTKIGTLGLEVRPDGTLGTSTGGAQARPATAQPQAQPPAAAPPQPPRLTLNDNGLTTQQQATVDALGGTGKFTGQQRVALEEQYRQHNATQQTAAQTQQHQQQTAALAQQAAQRDEQRLRLSQESHQMAVDKAAAEAKAAGRPLQGNDVAIQHERILNDLTPKMRDGTATDEEKRLYAGSYYALQQSGATPTTMDDPNNPGQKIPATITRRIPPSFPEPEGGALPLVMMQPGAPSKAPGTEAQSRAGGYADRMQIAVPVMNKLDDITTYAQRGLERAGKFVGYNVNSSEYGLLRTAQEAFLAAALKKESGATITDAEWERDGRVYFPLPGESMETVRLKQRFRQAQMEATIREAGPGYKPASSVATPPKDDRPPLSTFQK